MPAWSLATGGPGALEWFTQRFIRARALAKAAGIDNDDNFDTIIAEDFANTITSELADVVGTADASPVSAFNAGVVLVEVGDVDDPEPQPASGRLQLTQPPSHVGSLSGKPWYIASLVKATRPPDEQVGDTVTDAIGLWNTDENRVGLGIAGGIGSGGSSTNWVGYAISDASVTSVLGPALDAEGADVWHLFEGFFDGGELRFWLDGIPFDDPIDVADLPDVPATLSMIVQRLAVVSGQASANYDKVCAVVRSPRVGEED